MALHERHRRLVLFKGKKTPVAIHPADARVAIAQGLAKPVSAKKAKAADAVEQASENVQGDAGDIGAGEATGPTGGDTTGS